VSANKPLLVDSDILIDVLRKHAPARDYLRSIQNPLLISAMTSVELWAGAKGRQQEEILEELLAGFDLVEVTIAVARRASEISYQFSKSHGTGAVDAVIAASTEMEGATLVTLNKKHYPMLAKGKVVVPYKK